MKRRPALIGTVYLIHFEGKVADHAGHYLGWASDLETRLDAHRAGTGARLMEVCKERSIPWSLVRTWEGVDRKFERALKNRKSAPRLCPLCSGAKAFERAAA